MDENRAIMFFCNGDVETIGDKEQHLNNYLTPDSKYLITHELGTKTRKPHFHFMVEMEVAEYTKYADAILRKKYKLKGNKKEYGRVSKIRDLEHAIAYSLKDEGEKRTNMDPDSIQQFLEISYRKPAEKDHFENCLNGLIPWPHQYEFSDTDIICKKIQILEYFKNNKLECNFNKVQRIFDKFLMQQEHLSASTLYDIMRQTRNNRL